MKKKLNTIFFSICFLASLLAEVYCFSVLNGDLFSVVGIGIVVLITGYLLLDSIRSKLKQTSDYLKFYMDSMHREETERWSERYSEILNIQKATYSAAKKNTTQMTRHFEELLLRLESLEENNEKALQKLIELQRKSLEGQKNALNLEINYNKQNTLHIINVLREEAEQHSNREQLAEILNALHKNNKLLKGYMNGLKGLEGGLDATVNRQEVVNTSEYLPMGNQEINHDFLTNEYAENASDTSWSFDEEQALEALNGDMNNYIDESAQVVKPTVIPLYDDPNKSLTADEIAALFESYGQ